MSGIAEGTGVRSAGRVSQAPEWNLKAWNLKAPPFPPFLGPPFPLPLISTDHRAIGTGGDHVNASQPEFHQEDFERLTTIRAIIIGSLADLHFRLEIANKA
jgi:hypothetical protein